MATVVLVLAVKALIKGGDVKAAVDGPAPALPVPSPGPDPEVPCCEAKQNLRTYHLDREGQPTLVQDVVTWLGQGRSIKSYKAAKMNGT